MLQEQAIKTVDTIEALKAEHDWHVTPLVLLNRRLAGDFNGLAQVLYAECQDSLGSVRLTLDSDFHQKSFERAVEKVSGFLTEDELFALETIVADMVALKDFNPQLSVETVGDGGGNNYWHYDLGFKQGRVLCAYNVAATEGKINEKIISFGLGTISRFTTSNTGDSFRPLKHRRPPMDGLSSDIPRLILKSMRAEFE